jgi:hypothetical protein
LARVLAVVGLTSRFGPWTEPEALDGVVVDLQNLQPPAIDQNLLTAGRDRGIGAPRGAPPPDREGHGREMTRHDQHAVGLCRTPLMSQWNSKPRLETTVVWSASTRLLTYLSVRCHAAGSSHRSPVRTDRSPGRRGAHTPATFTYVSSTCHRSPTVWRHGLAASASSGVKRSTQSGRR